MDAASFRRMDGLGLAALIAGGEVSPLEVAETAITVIAALNPALNAVIADRFAAARAEAARLPAPGGALRGVPFLLKDVNLFSSDLPTRFASRFFAGAAPAAPGGESLKDTVARTLPYYVAEILPRVLRGERVHSVQGVLSGSLSFLLERLHAGEAFSAALAEARRLGYTEPDPFEDLRAEDLARKLLVLARVAGFELENEALEVEPFCTLPPPQTEEAAFLAAEDRRWRAAIEAALAAGERYVMLAEVGSAGARVGLRRLPAQHPFAALPAGQNLVRIETELQRERPLWLGGPGAGPAITAAGVLGDVIAAASELRDRRYASRRFSVAA